MASCDGRNEGPEGTTDPGNGVAPTDDLDPANPPAPPFPDDPFPQEGTCGDLNAVVEGVNPTVQLLIDQSGSMTERFGNTDRWQAIYDTLMDPNGVVSELQSTIRFGLSLYTSLQGNEGGTCPVLTNVDATLDNFSAMDGIFRPAVPQDDTPTGESIDAVVAMLTADPTPGRKVIILGTDGEPDTCARPDPNDGAARGPALEAARRAYEAGIQLYVVSVGDDVAEDHLQDMANAGAGVPEGGTDAEFFVALSPQDLVDAFSTIVGNVSNCVFTINGEVDSAKASRGMVALDGNSLTHQTDWVLRDARTFEVLGSACETIKDGGQHQISAVFPCGSIVID